MSESTEGEIVPLPGYPAIWANYNWPGKFTPFEHQYHTARFFTENRRAFCFNEIGTAKSISALWAADYLMNIGAIRTVLIISPLSTLHTVWGMEIFSNITHRKYQILHGSKKKRIKLLSDETAEFNIINPDGIKVISKEIAAKKFDLVIVDEGAIWRNAQTQRYEHLLRICGPKVDTGVWWLTGAPMPKAPTDVWAQARIVCPDRVPLYFGRFRDLVMYQESEYKWRPRKGWEAYCYSIIQPAVRYLRSGINLPPVLPPQTREVEMSKEQKSIYNQMAALFRAEAKSGTITALNEGVKIMKLHQIACGAVYDDDQMVTYLDVSAKRDDLERVIDESGGKCIVFCPFRPALAMIEGFIKDMGYSVETIHGGVNPSKRKDIFHRFQHGDLQVLNAQPDCMAHGLTLTASWVIAWWSPTNNSETYDQAMGRISRPGQTKPQLPVRLVCSEVEKRIYKRLDNNISMQGLLMELLET